jgi:hypothetical protein
LARSNVNGVCGVRDKSVGMRQISPNLLARVAPGWINGFRLCLAARNDRDPGRRIGVVLRRRLNPG